MDLSQHAAAFAAQHTTGGLYLTADEVLSCAVSAVRELAGWAGLEDAAWNGTTEGVTAATVVSVDEWALIGPLFELLVERGNAQRLEACAGLGMPNPPRGSSEVAQSIETFRSNLPLAAFQCAPTSTGFPEGY
ncbi:hypothetical protein [Ideonella livida]|uniref:Uncharacterized protein n=1 Tax=Ideonella livida TaxID=2707176 RepID=A0A7C9THK7_9BURK|nr:hypothetical protein [Ideonella livida]NDY89702.1 hypothetical protein [Ideonella livida]